MDLAQDRVRRKAVVNTLINLAQLVAPLGWGGTTSKYLKE
jgi:hypothetical protein